MPVTTPRCTHCNTEEGEIRGVQGGFCCRTCSETHSYRRCVDCDEYGLEDEGLSTENGWVCEGCGDSYATCEMRRCGEMVHVDHVNTINGETICDTCRADHFTQCYACRDWVSDDDSRSSDSDDRTYCQSCYDERFTSCSNCGDEVRCEDVDDDGNCTECGDENATIHNHAYKPEPQFLGKGPLYLGWELEVECQRRGEDQEPTAEAVQSMLPVYCKEDGSLTNGFEVVSHPMSPSWIKGHRKDLEKALAYLQGKGFTSHDSGNCGLHVHISRKALSQLNTYKLLKLVYENATEMQRLSRRASNRMSYAQVFNKNKDLVRKAKGDSYERYEAVNLLNSKTVEIRIFRGTLKASSFFATLQFAAAVVPFTQQTSIPDVTWKNFIKFVASNAKTYPDLFNAMKERGVACV